MKPSRNDPCPCGSGKKYKKCCELKAHHKTIKAAPIEQTTVDATKMRSLFQRNVIVPSPKKQESEGEETQNS